MCLCGVIESVAQGGGTTLYVLLDAERPDVLERFEGEA